MNILTKIIKQKYNKLFKNGVQILVFDKTDHILLVKRADFPVWTLPGGHIEPGENKFDAANRELYEETGLRAHKLTSINIYKVNWFPPAGITEVFKAKGVSGIARISNETREIQYFKCGKLPWNLLPYLRRRIASSI